MKRKQFLSSLIPLASLGVMPDLLAEPEGRPGKYKLPKALKYGDTIGITCTGGPVSMVEINPAIRQFESWGFKVRVGSNPGRKYLNFGGTDKERQEELQEMLDDDRIQAIVFARGGYGTVRILDKLDLGPFLKNPKWLLGFSDLTYLHSLILGKGVACIHSKMCSSFPSNWEEATEDQKSSILSIKEALTGLKCDYKAAPHPSNIFGDASGPLLGGNLRILESLSGSPTSLKTEGCILFLEDTMEYAYSIDRMLWNLLRSGKLEKLKGLIIGGFRIKPDDPGEEFGMSLEEIILEKVKDFGYPVCFGFPVGHQPANVALKCGVTHRFTVNGTGVFLKEH